MRKRTACWAFGPDSVGKSASAQPANLTAGRPLPGRVTFNVLHRPNPFRSSIHRRGMVVSAPLFAMFGLGGQDILLLLVPGVLLVGRKLPEIGRSLGKTVVAVKKGLRGIE